MWLRHIECTHMPIHRQTHTPLSKVLCMCMYVCALHNAGVEVSGLIFYLSGVITIAFTAALLWSVEDTASLLNLNWEKEKLHVYNL